MSPRDTAPTNHKEHTVSNTTNTTTLAARQAARAKRIAKAQMVEDVADAKIMLQEARDNGINADNADYLRGLIESIIEATLVEEEEPTNIGAVIENAIENVVTQSKKSSKKSTDSE